MSTATHSASPSSDRLSTGQRSLAISLGSPSVALMASVKAAAEIGNLIIELVITRTGALDQAARTPQLERFHREELVQRGIRARCETA